MSALPFRSATRSASSFRLLTASPLASSSRLSPVRTFTSSLAALDAVKKPSMSAIAAIRKAVPGTSMIKAREALQVTFCDAGEDVQAALSWLDEDRRKSGAKRAEKVADRQAKEGVVGLCILSDGLGTKAAETTSTSQGGDLPTAPPRAGLVELNCETDFVARNEVFQTLVNDLSHTAALFTSLAGISVDKMPRIIDLPVADFLAFPVMPSSPDEALPKAPSARPKSVQDAIIDVVSRLGEKISLARVSSVSMAATPEADEPRRSESVSESFVASAFAHGATNTTVVANKAAFAVSVGKVASLMLTRYQGLDPTATEEAKTTMRALTRSLARQAAGMETTSIRATTGEDATALYSQPFMMLLPTAGITSEGEESVQGVLQRWGAQHKVGVEVMDMKRWTLGETQMEEEVVLERS